MYTIILRHPYFKCELCLNTVYLKIKKMYCFLLNGEILHNWKYIVSLLSFICWAHTYGFM